MMRLPMWRTSVTAAQIVQYAQMMMAALTSSTMSSVNRNILQG